MNVINTRNVHQVLPYALALISEHGVRRDSRNGPVLMMESPTTTVFNFPEERVMFWPQRDCNPFFHFYESLWMLAGRNDVAPLAAIVPRMKGFSDDGDFLWGAYGHRWRRAFQIDQLKEIVENLQKNPECRRQVLQMWDAELDLSKPNAKDVPCNTMATFQVNPNGVLDLAVFCRSNDIVWGAYGANAVHFSMLLEYMARSIGVPVGRYYQISINWHAYLNVYENIAEKFKDQDNGACPYQLGEVKPFPLMQTPQASWDNDLKNWLNSVGSGSSRYYNDPFFEEVATPLMRAHRIYKNSEAGEQKFEASLRELSKCHATDWRRAGIEWIQRRWGAWRRAQEDGINPDTMPEGRPQ